jgi:hypothetical protein
LVLSSTPLFDKENAMNKLPLISLAFVLSLGTLSGCGGGASGVNSGVDEAKPANEVTDDEAERICEAAADYSRTEVNQVEVACLGQGMLAAVAAVLGGGEDEEMQSACKTTYDGCLEDAPVPDEPTCGDATADSAMCDDSVTVGEVQTCLTDQVDAYKELVDTLPSCSEVTMDTLEDISDTLGGDGPLVEQPASCDDVVEACPGLSELGG